MEEIKKIITYKRYFNPHFKLDIESNTIEEKYGDKPLIWASTGRGNLINIIKLFNLKKKGAVLMPAFVAHGVYLPFKKSDIQIIHYKTNQNLAPDIEDIKNKIRNYNIGSLIVIHYFGIPQLMDDVLKIAKLNGIFVIEDCAQALLSKDKQDNLLGFKGDVSLFSLNKFLPVADGSFFRINTEESIPKIKYRNGFISLLSIWFANLYLYFKKHHILTKYKTLGKLSSFISTFFYLFYYKLICYPNITSDISNKSKLSIQKYNFEKMLSTRKKLFEYAYYLIKRNNLEKFLFSKWDKNYNGNGLPILINNPNKLKEWIRNYGVELLRYEKHWFFNSGQPILEFNNQVEFYKKHILIPINENVSIKEIEKVILLIKNYIETNESNS